jgi:hypothetical protein
MTKAEAMKIKAHCEANGYKIVMHPGSETFRAYKKLEKPNDSRTQIRVVALICFPRHWTVEVTIGNYRNGLGGLYDCVEVKKSIGTLEELKALEGDEDRITNEANYFFQ